MRKLLPILLSISFLSYSINPIFSQEVNPTVKNIFDTVKANPKKGLWNFKKTALHRINVVKMVGESKMHKHPDAEHTILLIKGSMIAEVGGNKIKLKEGDMLSIPAGMPHKYWVKGKKAIIISTDAPYYNPDKTIMLE